MNLEEAIKAHVRKLLNELKEKGETPIGIDIYLHWKGQRSAEMAAQLTDFRVDKGNIGYLREGYHGGPYATMALLPEGWNDFIELDEDGTFAIEAKTLRERLPATVMVAIYRQETVYGQGSDPSNLELIGEDFEESIRQHLAAIFATMQDRSAAEIVANTTDEQKRQAAELIAKRKLPDYALSFVDFVDLAEKKRKRQANHAGCWLAPKGLTGDYEPSESISVIVWIG